MTIAIDGHAQGTAGSASSVSASLTTANAGDVIVAIVQSQVVGTQRDRAFPGVVLSDAGSKIANWKLQYEFLVGDASGPTLNGIQIWWGTASSTMSGNSITATFPEAEASSNLIVFGVSGANTSKPFDNNSSIWPGSLQAGSAFGSHSAPEAFSTSCTNSMIVTCWGTDTGQSPNSPDSGYTAIEATANATSKGQIGCMQKVVSATQSSIAPSMGTVGNHSITSMGFAIAAAGETNCTDKPSTPLIAATANGHAASSTTVTGTLTTAMTGGVIIALVARNSNVSVTLSDVGSHIAWTKYGSTLNQSTDAYLDIWWGTPNALLSGDTITATFSGSSSGSISLFHVINVDTSNPFDSHSGLPATNLGGFGNMTTGSGSTNNGDVMVITASVQSNRASPQTQVTGPGNPTSAVSAIDPWMFCGNDDGTGSSIAGCATASVYFAATAPSSKTFTIGSSNSAGDWVGTWFALQIPNQPSGTWGSTEVKDTFAANSAPAGIWGSTEAKDTMAVTGHIPAAIPTFVNAGTLANQSVGMSITPALPASRVNGNLLLCMVGNGANTGQVFTFPGDWTVIDSFHNGNVGAAWAYRYVDGTETDPTITWPLSTSANAQIWQFHGVVTIGAKNQLDDQGFIATYSATALATTAANSLVVNLEYNNNAKTISGTPTGYTVESNTAPFGVADQGVTTLGNSSNAISAQALSGSARWISAEIELCSSLPPIIATWGSTEAKDAWTSHGSLIGGSWHSTEAKDIASMSGYVPLMFAIGLTEHADIMNFAVFEPPFGVLGATEAHDIFDWAGTPTPPLSVDAVAHGGAGNNSTASFTSADVTITTSFKDDIIVLGIQTGGFWVQGDVTSITDTSGLFWQKRNKRQIIQNHLNGTQDSFIEEWWAHKPLPGATTITVNTNLTGAIAIEAVAVAGANTAAPFDTHTGAAAAIDNYSGNIIDPEGRGHFGNPAMLVYTDSPKTLTLAFHASPDTMADTSVPAGFTFLDRCEFDEHSGNTLFMAVMSKAENTQQFGTTDVWFGPDATHITNRYMIVDSIVGSAESTSTNDLIRWYFDGTGNRTIAQFGTGQNSTAMNVVTFREDSIMVVAVMSLSGANSRVDHISDDANTSGWTRRSIVTDSSGAVCMEVWWVKMADAFSGNITINMDAQIQNGDFVSAIAFAIQGADAFQRGEIWDSNGTLPATNHSTAGIQTVGPFNTSNDNVLVFALGANIDTTTNDVDPTGKNRLPFLQLPAPGELVSDGPPSFNIALDYKFSGPVVTGASAEFDISPSAQSWLMIADAMPVGPVSPPHGALASVEPQDRTTHNGDFTAIGIASPQGWVGFPPNHATIATSEHKDTTSNSGAFTAIWRMDEGWIAYVPAFMAWASTEHDDSYHNGGWILGPTTILARMHAGEAPDRLGFSSPFTFYTTRYSAGDRTSLITVTTNATLDAGTIDNLVDGVKANGSANAVTFHATQPDPVQILFDFGIPMLVSEATMYQNGPFAQPGLWHWRASNDLSAWDILTADAILNSGNIGTVVGSWPTNTTLYRYYELIQTTNAGMADIPQIWEMEFKVGGNGGTMAVTERKDNFSGNMLAIPTATPIPARKRRLLIVT